MLSLSELPATCLDVYAPAQTHGRLNTAFDKDFLESQHPLLRRGLIVTAYRRIERNQVNVAEKPLQQIGRLLRVLIRVVQSLAQGVFKGDATSPVADVGLAGLKQVLQRVAPIHRHKLISQGIVRCM